MRMNSSSTCYMLQWVKLHWCSKTIKPQWDISLYWLTESNIWLNAAEEKHVTEAKASQTHLGEDNVVLCATLWTAHCSSSVSFLFLIKPALQTWLVDPFSATFTPAGADPLCAVVISLSGKTNPTVSGKARTSNVLIRYWIFYQSVQRTSFQ